MAKELSPKKYIEINARKLPIYKCMVNKNWEATKMANIVIMRQHVNGNVTVGIYLVDLSCLGIKDTFFYFNESVNKVEGKLDAKSGFFTQIDYNLAHNIVFAGHDYALDYDINPHLDFSFTKYILEVDDDDIPLIDIKVGGPNGTPHLILQPGQAAKYKHVYDKLVKNLGKDNFYYTMEASVFEKVDSSDDYEEDEKMAHIEDFPMGTIKISDAMRIDLDDLGEAEKIKKRISAEMLTLNIEFALRIIQFKRSHLFYSEKELDEKLEYILYQESEEHSSWVRDEMLQEFVEMMENDIYDYHQLEKKTDSDDILIQFDLNRVKENVDKYQHNPYIVSLLYEKAILQKNVIALLALKPIMKKLAFQYVSHKLEMALCSYFLNESDPNLAYIIEGTDLKKIFPIAKGFSEEELYLFAMLRLLVHTRNGNLKEAIYYYQFAGLVQKENPLIILIQEEFDSFIENEFRNAYDELKKEAGIEDDES